MLLEKYEPQSSGSIFSSQVSTTDQQSGRPSITKLPRIPNTPSIQNSSLNTDLLPSQSRPTVFIPNIERASPLFLLENPIGRGPKIYTKNLPDVFTSGSTVNRNKKFHGIKERNQADDAEQSSLHIGTPTVSTKKTHGQPLISPARVGQYPSIKGGRKTNDPFDVHPASMKENIEGYSLQFGNLSPKKDVKLLKNERTGMSPFRRRNNKIRIRTNIEYGSVFDTNSNIVKNNDGIKEEDMKKQPKKVVVVKKSNTSDSRFFDENNEEVKIKLIDKSAILGSIPILQLNELITIKKVKTTMRNGVIKRMLHVPSFKMFDVLEESTSDISSKENNDIKAWITNWKNSFQRSQRISKIYSCFWNSPEGCVSVVCEPARNGFLTDVIDQHGSLPEKALQSIGKNLLEGISEMHSKIFKPHGNITPRDILVGSKGSLKITPAISAMFPNGQKVEQKSPRATEGILFRPSIRSQQPGLLDARPWSSLSSAVDLSQDIFDFGFTLLQCALGDFSVFDMNSPISLENIKPILITIALQRKPDACCLLHSEDFVRKMLATSNASASSSRRRLTNSNFGRKRNKLIEDLENSFHSDTPYVSLLEALVSINHFSEGFVDLLCSCLRFDREQRPKADELLEHKFFSEAYQVKGPLVTFQELVGLGSKSAGNVENENEAGLNKLAEALRMVLLNRNVKDKFDLIMQRRGKNQIDDKAVMELAGELGVSYPKLKKKLNECLLDLQV